MSGNELIHDEVTEQIIDCARRLVTEEGRQPLTVRDILRELNVTNRVFYNRFRNIDEVLDIIYREMVGAIRRSLLKEYTPDTDFFEYVLEIGQRTLQLSYRNKGRFSQYIFDSDSARSENYDWWMSEITALIRLGKREGKIRGELDEAVIAYAVWCFIRGFNADAMRRQLPEETAVERFRYGFMLMLNGMR